MEDYKDCYEAYQKTIRPRYQKEVRKDMDIIEDSIEILRDADLKVFEANLEINGNILEDSE